MSRLAIEFISVGSAGCLRQTDSCVMHDARLTRQQLWGRSLLSDDGLPVIQRSSTRYPADFGLSLIACYTRDFRPDLAACALH